MKFPVLKDDRLDRFLRSLQLSPWLGKRAWEEAIQNGWVRVDGKVARKPGQEVLTGFQVELSLPPFGLSGSTEVAEFLEKRGSLYFFQKPAGIPTYPLSPFERDSLAHRIAAFFSEQKILSVSEFEGLGVPPILEGGILHRLDRDTSGIVACATDLAGKQKYRELFSGSVQKRYEALVSPVPKEGSFSLSFPSLVGKTVKAVVAKEGPNEVELKVKVLAAQGDVAWISVATHQGLRHVVRAGMAALGSPLVGDQSYGGSARADHHQLHAISLTIPEVGEVSAPIARSFLDCAKQLGFNREG